MIKFSIYVLLVIRVIMYIQFTTIQSLERHIGLANCCLRLPSFESCMQQRKTTSKIACLCQSIEINSSPPGQNGHLFADDIFVYIFVNEKCCIWITISLKFVPEGPFDCNSALVQIMASRTIGGKPLSAPMLPAFTDAYMRH